MQKSLAASLAQLIIDRWIRKSAFPLYRACMASAICKRLKQKGDIDLSSRVFGKMTRTQPIDESLNREQAVDGYMWPKRSEQVTSAKANANTLCVVSNMVGLRSGIET
jgi:hypothetical protein